LHKNDVVHGDLKAINILVSPSGRACIADFGLSSITNPMTFRFTHSTMERGRGGTPRYQAPELFRDDTQNHFGSDVYAFACVCYEIMTGKVPFYELSNDMAVMLRVLAEERPSKPFSWSNTAVLNGLWDLMHHCWKDQSHMRPTAVDIVGRLMGPTIEAT
ncbi:kinase-like domain-containing protein, partial [Mycena capillaripes]